VGRQLTIVFALLAACGLLVAAMAWATAARGDEPVLKPQDVLRVEAAVTQLSSRSSTESMRVSPLSAVFETR
jgi:hypothetical protein